MQSHTGSATAFVTLLDGLSASTTDLAPLAFAGHAHFTAMQVRGGQVRGLDLHLQRLQQASRELFGQALPDALVRAQLRAAVLQGPADLSLTATIYSSAGEFTATTPDASLHLLVRTAAANNGPAGPLTLMATEHERHLAHLKHVGEIAKTQLLHQAMAQGFDDAAFMDRHGRLSEATIWNLAFWDGNAVVWPEAAMLAGTTQSIILRQLHALGLAQRTQPITLASLPALRGAAVMNSWTAAVPVQRIANVPLPAAPDFVQLLHRAFQAEVPKTL